MALDRDRPPGGRTVKASEFKTECLNLVDEVLKSGDDIVITRNGRPVAKLTPYRERLKTPFGRDRGRIKVLGDIVSPMPAEWFENSRDSEEDLF